MKKDDKHKPMHPLAGLCVILFSVAVTVVVYKAVFSVMIR